MNTKNNQRHRETIAAIDTAFVSLLKEKELKDISVSELCEKAGVNRSTFYENYADVFALANAYSEKIENQVVDHPHTEGEFAWIFDYIKANADVFEIYSVAKMWFEVGCIEPTEQMGEIVKREHTKMF